MQPTLVETVAVEHRACDWCGATLDARQSKFCSRSCTAYWRWASGRDGVREEPAQERSCEWCGASLGPVPAYLIRKGGGRFCNRSCSISWRWAHEREGLLEPLVERKRQLRKYEPEHRHCQRCGKDLGLVAGHRLHQGRGRFCSRSCLLRWQWETHGFRRQLSGQVVTCECGRETRYLRPSRAHYRYCRRCRHLSWWRDPARWAKWRWHFHARRDGFGALGGRPRVEEEIERQALAREIVKLKSDHPDWGYRTIAQAVGGKISHTAVGNVIRRHIAAGK